MLMFPVVFQPQITANSVIRRLLWPLCQPGTGPLTVCWPGAILSQSQYARTFSALAPSTYKIKNLETTVADSHGIQVVDMVTMKPLFFLSSMTHYYFCIPFLWEVRAFKTGDNVFFSNYNAGHLTLEPSSIVLTWSSSTALRGLKGSIFTLTALFSVCSLFNNLLGGRTCHFVSHCMSMNWKHIWQW